MLVWPKTPPLLSSQACIHWRWYGKVMALLSLWTLLVVGLFKPRMDAMSKMVHDNQIDLQKLEDRMRSYEKERQHLTYENQFMSVYEGVHQQKRMPVHEGSISMVMPNIQELGETGAGQLNKLDVSAGALSQQSPPAMSATETASRRLGVGFYVVGTTGANVGCESFAGATALERDMSSDNCRTTGAVCSGCWIATADGNNKIIEIISCSSAKYKAGSGLGSGPDVVEITVINADSDNTVTIKGCDDTTCSSPDSTYTLSASSSVVGYCYQAFGNAIFFNPVGEASTPTFSTVNVGTGGFLVSSTKVVGAQQTHIADATATLPTDGSATATDANVELNRDAIAELQTSFNSLLSKLETHGLLASS